ncbi:uncharacterized protein Bfra_003985 [Botrytis fragariae]|uniref:Uncharacterized protein n=1 Tax=Botrytis fragariae TaxID=1964551 RepID=A0A8H6AXW0_9HELO|nr:uncharacterized protein Bfra_003985 [Botrytis fragariae]KAF5875532.1 hypothetical protein Bfra_003985 [Botrytis fragariae]
MGLLKFIIRKIKGSRHKKHTSHTKKSSKSNKTNTSYQREAPNDGSSRGRPQDSQHAKRTLLPHRSEHRNENSSQKNHVHKTSHSVERQITYIGDYIDDWNSKNPPPDGIKIDIIVLGGLLDMNQNLTEPRSGSRVKFISNPEEPWDELSSEKLQRACKKLEWHTHDRWYPYTLDSGVRKRMFEVTDNDRAVHKSKMKGLIIRRPPPDYRICQRIDRLGGRESNPQLYDTKLSGIVEDIESYIKDNKKKLEGIRSRSKNTVTPRDLIEKWQKEYHFKFSNVLRWLKDNRVELSKPREHNGTRIRHESHRVNGPHDSAVFLPTGQRAPSKSRAYSSNYGSESDTSTSTRPRRVNKQHDSVVSLSGAGERAPSKSRARKPSDNMSGSDTSTHPRRRTPNTSQPLIQRKPQTKPNRDTLAKDALHSRPLITINSPSEGRGRSPSKSPNTKPPGRSPRTPQTPVNKNYVHQNPVKPPLPPSLYPSDHGRQKSSARHGSGDRGRMIPKRSHPELSHPSTSQSQSYSYPYVNSNEMRPRKSHPDLFNNDSNHSHQQQHLNLQQHSPYVNRKDGFPRPSNEDPYVPSPSEPEDMLWKDHRTREQIEEIHREEYKRLRSEGGIS